MKRLGFVLLLGALSLPAGARTAAPPEQDQLQRTRKTIQQERQDLRSVKQRLLQEQRTVQQHAQQEHSILKAIQRIDKALEAAEERFAEHQRNLVLVQEQLVKIRAALKLTEADLTQLKGVLAQRLRLLYLEGVKGFWHTLATAQTLGEAEVRLKFFHLLAAQNADWIERLDQRKREYDQQKAELGRREAEARALEREAQQDLERIKAQREARETMLGKVRRDRGLHEQAAVELAQASLKLNDLVKRLEEEARRLETKLRQARAPVRWEGKRFPWPTRGRVVQHFGKVRFERFNTYLIYKGIDIAGTMGQNVVAVAPGRVLFAEWFEGYGRMVILDHGGGLNTVYAHLQQILVSQGNRVDGRQVIGRLGDSGSWQGPALYFEVRRKGEALDPDLFLEP